MGNEYDPDAAKATAEADAKQRKFEARRDKDDVKWLMGNRTGRRIVWGLLEDARLYSSSFSTDTHVTAFNEGKRNYGLELLSKIHMRCPDEYNLMVKEHKSDAVDAAMAEFI